MPLHLRRGLCPRAALQPALTFEGNGVGLIGCDTNATYYAVQLCIAPVCAAESAGRENFTHSGDAIVTSDARSGPRG